MEKYSSGKTPAKHSPQVTPSSAEPNAPVHPYHPPSEMSAPHIPNLNNLRRGGFRSRGRGRGGSTVAVGENESLPSSLAKDEVIQKTDNDAATSRLSAVETGYLDDPFARLLTPGQHARRLPLMNRGTYVRTTAIDRIVDTFLGAGELGRKQIISLGAGSDTRYFRLRRLNLAVELIYHELDFAVNTRGKIALLTSTAFVQLARTLCEVDLHSRATVITDDGSGLHSAGYHIHAVDLRQLPQSGIKLRDIDRTCPTLIISECCLIYLSPTDADRVLGHFDNLFSPEVPLAIAIYEPIRPSDAFGRTMVNNLTARGIHLQTLEKYASLAAQIERLAKCGFSGGRRLQTLISSGENGLMCRNGKGWRLWNGWMRWKSSPCLHDTIVLPGAGEGLRSSSINGKNCLCRLPMDDL